MILTEVIAHRALSEAFPSLEVRSLCYFAAGWDYEVWELNSGLLVRFPLRPDCAERLHVEAALLRELQEHISLTIPAPLHYTDGVAAFPHPFFVYRKLPGAAMDSARMSDRQLEGAAVQLGQFLSELHAFPADRAAALGVPERAGERWRLRYVNLRARAGQDIYPLLDVAETERLESFWDRFLARADLVSFTPSLIHGDLAPDHILIDNGVVSGVIDFGDMRVGDPALDFAGFDATLRDRVASHYAGAADPTMLDRAGIYRDAISPFNYILFGQEHTAQSLIDEGLDQLRGALGGPP